MAKIPVRPSHAKSTSTSPSEKESSVSTGSPVGGPEPVALDLSPEELEGMRKLGFTNPGALPTENSSIPDLLLYGLVPHSGLRPDHGIVIGVAAELEAMVMFIEGPLGVALEVMARRLRVAIDIANRAKPTPSLEPA